MKISQKDAKLLILLACVALLASSYFYGFQNFNKKNKKIQNEITTIKVTYQGLVTENEKKAQYQKETKEYNQKMEEILANYPADLTSEKDIMFTKEIEDITGMHFKSLLFAEKSALFSPALAQDGTIQNTIVTANAPAVAAPTATPVANTATTDETGATAAPTTAPTTAPTSVPADTTAASVPATTTGGATTAIPINFIGYRSTLTMSYQSTYESLKEAIMYCVDYLDKKSIDSLTISFDTETGELTGNLVVSSYAIEGLGTTYEDPEIENIPIGLDNPFGSFEKSTGTQEDTTAVQ